MAATTHGARPIVALGGIRLTAEIERLIRRVVVESDAQAPDGCRIELEDPDRTALERAGFAFHATITVKAGRTGEDTEQDLFEGRIYRMGLDYDERGAVTTIGAFDNSYTLYNGLHTVTYRDVTDADLARRIAQEVGLQAGRIESTPVVHEHVAQVNETNWDFLRRRAAEIDHEVRVVGSALWFLPSAAADEAPEPGTFASTDRLQLTPGGNLEQFSARVTAAQQVTEIEVRGWDPQNKRELVATAPARSRAATVADSPQQLASGQGSPRHLTTWLPLGTQAEVEAAAGAEAERIAGTAVHAEGIAKGDPRIVAGALISIGQAGAHFDGKYVITAARHVFGSTGYRTHFTVSGRHDRSLYGLTNGKGVRAGPRSSGVVLGIVTNATDPEQLGRVKVAFPWLSDDFESHWARVVHAGAGADRGLLLPPEVNDEVLVAFEHGDSRRPFVLGGLYNGTDTPPFSGGVDAGNGTVARRGLRSRKGHEIVVTDADGEERIELRTADGKVRLLLDQADGGVTIEAAADVVIRAKRDLSLTADGRATITAQQGLRLESAAGNVTLKGLMVELNP